MALRQPAASDLREGKATLPVLDFLASGGPGARKLVEDAMASDGADSPEITRLGAKLQTSGAFDRAYAAAQEYASEAGKQMERFSDSPFRQALQTLPDLLIHRDR